MILNEKAGDASETHGKEEDLLFEEIYYKEQSIRDRLRGLETSDANLRQMMITSETRFTNLSNWIFRMYILIIGIFVAVSLQIWLTD